MIYQVVWIQCTKNPHLPHLKSFTHSPGLPWEEMCEFCDKTFVFLHRGQNGGQTREKGWHKWKSLFVLFLSCGGFFFLFMDKEMLFYAEEL